MGKLPSNETICTAVSRLAACLTPLYTNHFLSSPTARFRAFVQLPNLGSMSGQHLQRDIAAQLGIGGLIHLSYAPLADEGGHVIVAKPGADAEWHGPPWTVERKLARVYA